MGLPLALEDRVRIGAFQRKHHVRLLALLFSDIVGSTDLKRIMGDLRAVELIQTHHAVVREILLSFSEGEEISTGGDSFFIVFTKPSDAVKFALLLQSRLRSGLGQHFPVIPQDRIGIHVGEVLVDESGDSRKKDLYGIQVDTCWRVTSLATGNQILLTRAAFDHARQALKGQDLPGIGPLSWLSHGAYTMQGLEEPAEICEVGEEGKAKLAAPPDGEKAYRQASAGIEPVPGWRPAVGAVVPHTHWVLDQKLGEGGFGEVWLGCHASLKEQRVFKFCFRAERVRSLKREVAIFRLLKGQVGEHPNIVGVQDVFFDRPPFYLMMDSGAGRDLKKWCESQGGADKLPLSTRLEIVAQVADALQAAHEAGVLHRDIKPSNILVNDSVRSKLVVKLTDFGIGQVISQELLTGLNREGFTRSSTFAASPDSGTLMYMAPELLAGKPASVRSDIYSLGVVLFQLVVGDFSRPVTSDWPRQVSDALLREDLEKCFAGDLERRYPSARELGASLRQLETRRAVLAAQEQARAARENAVRGRKRILRVAVAAAIVAAAGFWGIHSYNAISLDSEHQEAARDAKRRAEMAQREKEELRQKQHELDRQLAEALAELNELRAQKLSTNEVPPMLVASASQPRKDVPELATVPSPTGDGGELKPDLIKESAPLPGTSAPPTRLADLQTNAVPAMPSQLRLVSAVDSADANRSRAASTNSSANLKSASASVGRLYELQTGLIYNVLKNVDWPAAASASQTKVIKIRVLGESPLVETISVLQGKTINGNVLEVVTDDAGSAQEGPQVLFIAASEREKLPAILESLKGLPVLTAADTQGFAEQGVMVNFGAAHNRVVLEINQTAAERAGFKLSANLLKLSRVVH